MTTRGRGIAVSAVALATVAAGTLVAACGNSGADAKPANPAAAESAVRGFFTALTAGDAQTAVSCVELSAGSDPANAPLLADAALGPAYRPSEVRYGAARQESGLTYVDVTYQARGETVQQNVALAGDGKHLRNVLVG